VFVSALLAGAVAATVLAGPATAATAARPVGRITAATQDTFNHRLTIRGWAFDRVKPGSKIMVRVYADGHYVGQARTTVVTPRLDKKFRLTGPHGFALTVAYTPTARTLTIRATGATTSTTLHTLGSAAPKHTQPAAGTRIVTVAKRYVGHAKYRDGGASPKSGFDCSGYTKYVFAVAKVGTLPHNAEAQRRLKRMHAVSARNAKAGDLVFYLSGGSAYHVAIYAGHGMQYAAATPRDGIRYQKVWSSAVQYRRYV